jgi:hypothetical protein
LGPIGAGLLASLFAMGLHSTLFGVNIRSCRSICMTMKHGRHA